MVTLNPNPKSSPPSKNRSQEFSFPEISLNGPQKTAATSRNPFLEIVSKRLRSFNKRLTKIQNLEDSIKNGGKLDKDQLCSISKKTELNLVVQELQTISNLFSQMNFDGETFPAEKIPEKVVEISSPAEIPKDAENISVETFKNYLYKISALYFSFDLFKLLNIRNDFLKGQNNACKLSSDDLEAFNSLRKTLLPIYERSKSFSDISRKNSEILFSFLMGASSSFSIVDSNLDLSSFKNQVFDPIISSNYFNQIHDSLGSGETAITAPTPGDSLQTGKTNEIVNQKSTQKEESKEKKLNLEEKNQQSENSAENPQDKKKNHQKLKKPKKITDSSISSPSSPLDSISKPINHHQQSMEVNPKQKSHPAICADPKMNLKETKKKEPFTEKVEMIKEKMQDEKMNPPEKESKRKSQKSANNDKEKKPDLKSSNESKKLMPDSFPDVVAMKPKKAAEVGEQNREDQGKEEAMKSEKKSIAPKKKEIRQDSKSTLKKSQKKENSSPPDHQSQNIASSSATNSTSARLEPPASKNTKTEPSRKSINSPPPTSSLKLNHQEALEISASSFLNSSASNMSDFLPNGFQMDSNPSSILETSLHADSSSTSFYKTHPQTNPSASLSQNSHVSSENQKDSPSHTLSNSSADFVSSSSKNLPKDLQEIENSFLASKQNHIHPSPTLETPSSSSSTNTNPTFNTHGNILPLPSVLSYGNFHPSPVYLEPSQYYPTPLPPNHLSHHQSNHPTSLHMNHVLTHSYEAANPSHLPHQHQHQHQHSVVIPPSRHRETIPFTHEWNGTASSIPPSYLPPNHLSSPPHPLMNSIPINYPHHSHHDSLPISAPPHLGLSSSGNPSNFVSQPPPPSQIHFPPYGVYPTNS